MDDTGMRENGHFDSSNESGLFCLFGLIGRAFLGFWLGWARWLRLSFHVFGHCMRLLVCCPFVCLSVCLLVPVWSCALRRSLWTLSRIDNLSKQSCCLVCCLIQRARVSHAVGNPAGPSYPPPPWCGMLLYVQN